MSECTHAHETYSEPYYEPVTRRHYRDVFCAECGAYIRTEIYGPSPVAKIIPTIADFLRIKDYCEQWWADDIKTREEF